MTIPNDIRMKIANKIVSLSKHNRVIVIHKVTRAGATTSLISTLLKQKKKFLVVEPTNKIIQDTILDNIKKHCEEEPVIVHVPSNKECLINKEKIECNSFLGELPYLYLPGDCKECTFQKECPVTRILHEEHIDGIAITYDKLFALVFTSRLFEKSIASAILEKILNSIDYVVLDEAHELMYDKVSSLETTKKHGQAFVADFMRNHKNIRAEFGNKGNPVIFLHLLMDYFRVMNNPEVENKKEELLAILNDRTCPTKEKHQAASIPNPHHNMSMRYALKKEKPPEDNKDYMISGEFIGDIDEYKATEASKIIYDSIVELTECVGKFGIEIEDVVALCDMLNIVKSERLTVHCQKRLKIRYEGDKRIETWMDETEICVIDELRLELLRNFLYMHKGKILITSATLCSYDYSTLLRNKEPIKEVMFGPNGDPLNTNEKKTIFADTKSFSGFGKYSVYNRRKEIMQRCKDIMDIHGDNCLIICMNKEDWNMFKKLFAETDYHPQITYYKAPEVMGVESDKRVCILIGLAQKPSHAFDSMRPTPIESQILRAESMHADVTQAASRVKDPSGTTPSLVFALGCREEDLNNVFTWGIGRSLSTEDYEGENKPKVTDVIIAGEKCTKPNVRFEKNWPETLIASLLCKNYLYSKPQKVPYISDNNGTFQKNEYKINSVCALVEAFFGHKKVSALLKNKQLCLTDDLIAKHCAGKVELEFYSLQPDNTVNFVMFESKEEYAISRLKLFLDNLSIPYVIERIAPIIRINPFSDQFRVWILLGNTPADKASAFAQKILKKTGFKVKGNKEIEYYPRQTKRNTHSLGECIPMPFGDNAQILINGKFVKDFDEFTLGCVDLSSQPSDLESNKWIHDEGDDSCVSADT